MDEISNINFQGNENRPIFDNDKVNSYNILNRSAENKLSAGGPATFLQSSPATEKEILTNVNNNCQNDKPDSSFTFTEYSNSVISDKFEENSTSLTSEAGATKADSKSFNLVNETASSIETSNNISTNLSLGEIPVGNVNFLPDALSDKLCSDNQINLSNNGIKHEETSMFQVGNAHSVSFDAEELKDEKNKSSIFDSSFKEQENASDNLIGSFTAIDSVSKSPETSANNTLGKVSDIELASNKQEKPVSTSAELLETDCVKLPNEPATDSHQDSLLTDTTNTENCPVVFGANTTSPLSVSENTKKNSVSNVIASEKVSGAEPVKLDISANDYKGVNIDEAAFQVPENPSNNEFSPLKVEKVSFDMCDKPLEQFSEPDFAFKLPENPSSNKQEEFSPLKVEKVSFDISDKPLEQFSDFAFKLPENPSGNKQEEFSPLKEEKVSFDMSDKPLEQFSDPDSTFKLPENPSNEQDEFSPLKVEKVSFDMSDKPLEQFSVPDFAFKLPENTNNEPGGFSPLKAGKVSFGMSDKGLAHFSDADFAFKLPENSSNEPGEFSPLKAGKVSFGMSDKRLAQFSDPDFVFKVPEVPSNNPLEKFGDPDFAFKVPEKPLTNEGDEQFVDAVQFFRDPNSFQFLENIRTSTVQPGSAVLRSSLYVNFDPLHSKFQSNVPRPDNCESISAAVQETSTSAENSKKCSLEAVNKQLVDVAARESLGNILISFDSPKSTACVDSNIPAQTLPPPQMFTKEELQQKLKIHELETQEAYLKKQREMETEIAKRDELLKSQRLVIEEFCGISVKFSEDNRKNEEKIMYLEDENAKLKDDLKTSAEDLQSVENTFTDFYKRYEQCKGMLKTYKDNEEHLKQTILELQAKAKEQEQMYNMLQERTEEMLEKANIEVDNVKRTGEAQVTVLKAQLKKAEMKISSLESDIKQIKIENSQLGGICDDLMAKVSNS